MDPIVIDTWLSKNTAGRMRTGITWAEDEPDVRYIFGLHPLVFIVPSLLALSLMLVDPLGAL